MNNIMYNVYTIFKGTLEEYNRQRSEKIELGYIGECQGFYVFAGDWQNLFLINSEGGFEIYMNKKCPKTVSDIEACINSDYWARLELEFNYKLFIDWLYEENVLVKNIRLSNLDVIECIKNFASKIKSFESNIIIDKKSGLHKGSVVARWNPGCEYFIESYDYDDAPHCIVVYKKLRYRLYLPDVKPKTQKEMIVKPEFPFKKELCTDQHFKDIKHYSMQMFSSKSENGDYSMYYDFLLAYRSFNPDIKVEKITPNRRRKYTDIPLKYVTFCSHIVHKYANINGLNPFKILAEMYDKGYINCESRINEQKKEEFIKEYSYLCEK